MKKTILLWLLLVALAATDVRAQLLDLPPSTFGVDYSNCELLVSTAARDIRHRSTAMPRSQRFQLELEARAARRGMTGDQYLSHCHKILGGLPWIASNN